MDRNTLIGLVLIFAILTGSFYLMKPSEQELKQEQRHQDSLKNAKDGTLPLADSVRTPVRAAVDPAALLARPFGNAQMGTEETVTLENEMIEATITSKGGRIKSVRLKNEMNFDGGPVVLFDGERNAFGFSFRAGGELVHTNDLFFTSLGESANGDGSPTAAFRLSYDDGRYLEYVYSIKPNSYTVGLDVQAVGIQSLMDGRTDAISLRWETDLLQKERNVKSEREKSTLFYKTASGSVDHLSETGDDAEKPEGKLDWIAFKQHFFSSVLRSDRPFANADLKVSFAESENTVKHYSAVADLEFSTQRDNRYGFSFFFGPNQYKVLKAEGDRFDKLLSIGWGPMGWINKYVTIPVFNMLDGLHLSYGVIILILTLLLKAALFPLTYRSYQSMAKMRVLKPQIDAIKEKVGDDNPMLLQQESMKLYKQAGVNPLGGCLPLLLQMPFTLAFFFFFPNLFELRGQSFLWVKDLSTYDAPITFSPIFGIGHVSFMCILMTLTTLLTTWYNNATSGAAANNQMKYIGYFMPLIFLFVLNSFPAGLNYYYFLSAVLTFLTQVIIRRFVDDEKILAKIEDNKKNPKLQNKAQKKSAFQQKMEDMMRQQQAAGKRKK